MDRNEIENNVDDLLKKVQFTDSDDEVDVISIAKSLGFAVGNAVLEDDVDGFIIVEEGKDEILGIKTDKLIGVNSKRELAWKRFIIAHEIGHYRLHYSREKDNGLYAHRDHIKGKNEIENEADYFAANLLLPKNIFIEKFRELKNKSLSNEQIILLLADKFVATQKTVQRRIEELGLDG